MPHDHWRVWQTAERARAARLRRCDWRAIAGAGSRDGGLRRRRRATRRGAARSRLDLERPLLLEGEAGVGKTEVAKALAAVEATRLIRLQCYEGLDANAAIYEWNYQRQLLAIKAHEQRRPDRRRRSRRDIFSERFLLARPLLEAIIQAEPAGPADRRDRPRRRGVRGLPAGAPVRLPDQHPRARHGHARPRSRT